jgi:hypothetical protein
MSQLDEIIEKLMELDEDSLKAQLAIQKQKLANDSTSRSPSRSPSSDSLDSLQEALMATDRGGFSQEIINAGNRLFPSLNDQAYQLMCSNLFKDQDFKLKILDAYKKNSDQAAVLLTPMLASHLGLASSMAAPLAVLIIKTVFSGVSTIASATSIALRAGVLTNTEKPPRQLYEH